MFKNLFQKVRRLLAGMGIVKGIQSISKHKDIPMNEEIYTLIDTWKDLYKGYHEPFHLIKYTTIGGDDTRKMDSLNMAKTSAAEMASLVFNEKCAISIGDDENETSQFIDEVFKQNKFNKKFQDYLEYSFAHGGMVIKPYVEGGKVKLSFVTADCFIPIAWSNESIQEGVFINEFQKGDNKYTHLEWHVWEFGVYTVKNEVYESRAGDDLGVKVPLREFFPGLDETVGMPLLEKPLFVYFKPNTANNIDTQSPLGISIYANAIGTMKSIDTAFDSFHREFRLGKKRIIVPSHMVKVVIDPLSGEARHYFDSSDETYEAFNDGNMDETKIQDISVELRVEEHIAGINALLNIFAMQTGFSSGSFSFDGQSMKTATEVVSEQSKTFKSKQSHEVIIEAGLQELIGSIIAVSKLYKVFNGKDDYEVYISFDDSIAEDKGAEINQQIQLVSSQLTSKKRAIVRIHGVTDDEAEEILKEIFEEERQGSPDVDDSALFGSKE